MSEVKQCWAFHKDGARCEHPAGHPGKHVVSKEWDDSDCAIPGNPVQVPVPAPPMETLEEKAVTCIACKHSHKGGACKCGCHEFIG